MAEAKAPKFTIIIICAAIIIGVMITAIILHAVLWDVAEWPLDAIFAIEQANMIGLGIVLPAALIVAAIIGSKIYEKSAYMPLIFGIIITVIGGLLITTAGLYIYRAIYDATAWVPSLPQTTGIYVTMIIMSFVGLAVSIPILIGGIRHITYYTSHS